MVFPGPRTSKGETMCESKVVIKKKDGKEELVMEEAAALKYVGKKLVVVNAIGENVELDAEIKEVDLMGHKVILSPK
jgi:predicted RNA-binding protein